MREDSSREDMHPSGEELMARCAQGDDVAFGSNDRAESDTVTMMGAYCLLSADKLEIPIRSDLKSLVLESVAELSRESPGDYYSAFYYSSALAESSLKNAGDAREKIGARLLATQSGGEWTADDRWGDVGGRIYSTAMSLLALRQ